MMSLVAKALLIELRSWPEDLKINADTIRARYPDIGGRDKTRKVMTELIANNHLKKVVHKFNNGQFVTTYETVPGPNNQAPVTPSVDHKSITHTTQPDIIYITFEQTPCSDRDLVSSASRQYVANSYLYNSELVILGTSYPPHLAVGGEVSMNKWKEEEPSMVFGSVPEDEPQRFKSKAEKTSAANRAVKTKDKWSTTDIVFHFRDMLRLKRPMDFHFAFDKAGPSMSAFRKNHQTTAFEETRLVKDYLTFPQHYHSSMSALHVWFKFLTYSAANIGKLRAAGTAAPAMDDATADAILAASMERLMS